MTGVSEEGKSGGKGDREVGAAWGAETGATGDAGQELWAVRRGAPRCGARLLERHRGRYPPPWPVPHPCLHPACTHGAFSCVPALLFTSVPWPLSVCWAGPSAVKCLLTLLSHRSSPVKRFLPCVPTSTIHRPHYCGYHIAVIIINASLPC